MNYISTGVEIKLQNKLQTFAKTIAYDFHSFFAKYPWYVEYIYPHIINLIIYQLNHLLVKTHYYEKIYFCGS